jgi:hypothetical protein
MNSTSIGIKTFATTAITELFCILDEYACLGTDPRKHPQWESFLEELREHHWRIIEGILIFSYKDNDTITKEAFSFMIIPSLSTSESLEKSFSLSQAFTAHRGRTIVDFVDLFNKQKTK